MRQEKHIPPKRTSSAKEKFDTTTQETSGKNKNVSKPPIKEEIKIALPFLKFEAKKITSNAIIVLVIILFFFLAVLWFLPIAVVGQWIQKVPWFKK